MVAGRDPTVVRWQRPSRLDTGSRAELDAMLTDAPCLAVEDAVTITWRTS